jgi:hypothetical protein
MGRYAYWGVYELPFFTKCYHNTIGRARSIQGYNNKCTDVRTTSTINITVLTAQKTIRFHIKNRILLLSSLRLIWISLLQIFSPQRAAKLCTSGIQTNQLLLNTDILAVCSEIHMKHINTHCENYVKWMLYLVVHYVTNRPWFLKLWLTYHCWCANNSLLERGLNKKWKHAWEKNIKK